MVQSIFDDKAENEQGTSKTTSFLTPDTPLSLVPDEPYLPTEPPQPADDKWGQPWPDEAPTVVGRDAPATKLDGTQRYDAQPDPPNLYAPTPSRYDVDPVTVRRSGLAWSAGIAFFGAVAFMLFIGWGADLLFGSSPWGLVLGIVLGSVMGFIQFFRISSQIYAPKPGPDVKPLMSSRDDEER